MAACRDKVKLATVVPVPYFVTLFSVVHCLGACTVPIVAVASPQPDLNPDIENASHSASHTSFDCLRPNST